MPNLYAVIVDIIQKELSRAQGGDTPALYQAGVVRAVNEDGTYVVSTPWGTITANPETDLPLTVGAAVNVSRVENGKPVIHGPRFG